MTVPNIVIRSERPDDIGTIAAITRAAFSTHPHSSHTEQFIVDALRRAGALAISLVADCGGEVVGHIAFSPVAVADGSDRWYGLGPVSVAPECQRRGIGQLLVHSGLDALRALGAHGCMLLGEPSFYGRFGFANQPGLILDGVPQEYFLALAFGTGTARGRVAYHPAFDARE